MTFHPQLGGTLRFLSLRFSWRIITFFFMPWPSIGRSLGSTWWITCTVAFMGTFGPPMVLKRSKEKLRQKSSQFHHSRKCSRNTKRWRISKIFCFSAHRQGKPNLWVKSFCLHFFRLDLGFGDGVGTLGKKKTAVFSDGSNKWVYGMGSEAHELNNFRHFHMFSYIFIIWYYIYKYIIYHIYIHYRIIWKSLHSSFLFLTFLLKSFFQLSCRMNRQPVLEVKVEKMMRMMMKTFWRTELPLLFFSFSETWQILKKRSPRTGCNRFLFFFSGSSNPPTTTNTNSFGRAVHKSGPYFGMKIWWKKMVGSHGEIRQKDWGRGTGWFTSRRP